MVVEVERSVLVKIVVVDRVYYKEMSHNVVERGTMDIGVSWAVVVVVTVSVLLILV